MVKKRFWNLGRYFATATRSNMEVLTSIYQQKLMNMRGEVETVFSSLKDRFQLVTSISRSVNDYLSIMSEVCLGMCLLEWKAFW